MIPRALSLFLIILMLSALAVNGQEGRLSQINAMGFTVSFQHERSKQILGSAATNVLKIQNNTNRPQEVTIRIGYPTGWKLIGKEERTYTMMAGDSLFIPVRILPDKRAAGNTTYLINVAISSNNLIVGNAQWQIAIERISEWYASLPERRVYFQADTDTAHFKVHVFNQGNSDEHLLLTLSPGQEILVVDREGNPLIDHTSSFIVPVGKDTVLVFRVRREIMDILPTESEFLDRDKSEHYNIKVKLRNERVQTGSRTWTGNAEFIKVRQQVRYRSNKYAVLPMTIDFNTYDLFKEYTYATLDIYGAGALPGNRSLTYYYQSNYNSNLIDVNAFLGQFHYIGYQGKIFRFDAGNIGASRSGINLSGKGALAGVSFFNNTISALYVKNPGFKEAAVSDGYALNHTFKSRVFTIDNFYQRGNQYIQKTESEIFTSDMTLRIMKRHSISFHGGISKNNLLYNPSAPVNLSGNRYMLRYGSSFRKFSMNFSYGKSSPNHLQMGGMTSASGNISYKINPRYLLSGSYTFTDYRPELYFRGVLIPNKIFTRRDQANLRLNITTPNAIFILNPNYQHYQSRLLNVVTRGVNLDYRLRGSSSVRVSSSVFAGYSRSLEHDIKDFFVSQVRANVSYYNFKANLRYFFGPYYAQEQLVFLRTGDNMQKLYVNAYYDLWFASNRALLKTNLNYNYTSMFNRQMLAMRPELFYYTESNLRLSMYGRYIFMGQSLSEYSENGLSAPAGDAYDSKLEFGFGLKLDISIPMTFDRFYELEVYTFRDLNANAMKENNEEGISNMLIRLQRIPSEDSLTTDDREDWAFEAITGNKGRAVFTKVPVGEYYLNAIPISSNGSWFDGKTMRITVDKNRKVYIPLNKGARLSGSVMIDRDRYSRMLATLNWANIRVTAVDTSGRSYSALTDSEGRFTMFLPNGRYQVSMNEAAFGDAFEFLQNDIQVTLSEEFENYNITFFLVERSRELRVRRFNGNGAVPDDVKVPVRREGAAPVTPEPVPAPADTTPVIGTDDPEPEDAPAPEVYVVPLPDELFLPVTEINEKGTYFRVQLFESPKERIMVSELQNLPEHEQIVCIGAEESLYHYYSKSFSKAKQADKYLDKIIQAGFTGAVVVKFVDGNKVPF